MKHRLVATLLLLVAVQSVIGQAHLPVIRASSKTVDIRDGLHFKKGFWYIMPEKKPDIYYAELPHKGHNVTFITDMDTVSFMAEYGHDYDFIILLNGKDSCYTRIAARYKQQLTYTSSYSSLQGDTLPFTIGDNSKIYFKGKLNNSEPLNIQFDLGAGGCQIKKSSVQRVKMDFDSSIILINSDGRNRVPLSSLNKLEIAHIKCDSIPFAVSDNMTAREDLIASNSIFQDKIIEINYDKKIIVIHDTLRAQASFSKHDIILDGVVPYLQGTLTMNAKTKKGWFMFDTGAYTTILRTNEVSSISKMYIEAKRMIGLIGKNDTASSPQLSFGAYNFHNFNYTVEKSGTDSLLGLLGNDLLKRFNVLLDNRNGYIYLQPNLLVNEPYRNPEYYVVRVITFLLVLSVILIIYFRYKKRY